MRRVILAALGVSVGLFGCATAGGPEPVTGYPALEKTAGPDIEPRELGRPVERLDAASFARVEEALQAGGWLDPVPLPGEMRLALLAVQREEGLAPTGWLDADTASALGLEADEVLPIEAGAGAYWSAGATLDGGMVGGEPGPASLPPDPAALGASQPAAPADPAFQFAEARRLRAAARVLRGRAARAEGRERAFFEAQAAKAESVFRLHAEQLEDLGGATALAGLELVQADGEEAVAGIEEGEEVRAAYGEDLVELSPEEIERMQRTLWAEGFYHQAPNGQLDDPTRQAIRAWQTAQGWVPTGAVDEGTADRLVSAPQARTPQGLEPPGSPQPGGAAPPQNGQAGAPAGGEGNAETGEDLPAD